MSVGTFPELLPYARIRSGRQWQDISFVPRDGTPVLLYCPDAPEGDRQFVASWQNNRGADGSRPPAMEWCEIVSGLPGLDAPHRPKRFAVLPAPDQVDVVYWDLHPLVWQPIKLAPRDGTPLLVYSPRVPRPKRLFAARWEGTDGVAGNRAEANEWCEVVTGLPGLDGPLLPTLFMPLQADPQDP